MQYVGIYNADGTVLGEIAYVLAKYTGRGHCELCDITHGALKRKPAWDDACARVGVHIDLRHRDEVTEEQLSAAGDLPAVIGFRDGRWVRVMGPEELGACEGDPNEFVTRLLARGSYPASDSG